MKVFFYFLTPIYIFIGIPVIEAILTFLKLDDKFKGRSSKDIHWIFNWMLYINILLVYGVLIYALIKSVTINMISLDFLGILLTIGLVIVSNGINVAHELCHRKKFI
jgi:alkane 1-monooxygenase